MKELVLAVNHLSASFHEQKILDDLSFELGRGEIVGLLGRSGSGKSLLTRVLMGLEPKVILGSKSSIVFHDDELGPHELIGLRNKSWQRLRGNKLAMIFQEPRMAFNPVQTVGYQLSEMLNGDKWKGTSEKNRIDSIDWMNRFELTSQIFERYPFEISGGEAQRMMVAVNTILKPKLMFADEPTTSLDKTNETSVLNLLNQLREETGMTILIVSHDQELLKSFADRLLFLEHGKIYPFEGAEQKVESKRSKDLQSNKVILEVNSLTLCKVGGRKLAKPILNKMSFQIFEGETLGLIGPSGSGKTTLMRCILGLEDGFEGKITFNSLMGDHQHKRSRDVQAIFQDPLAALNPRLKVRESIDEALIMSNKLNGQDQSDLLSEILEDVQISNEMLSRFPHQLSGGERQRACLVRALVMKPRLIILDEPVTALDHQIREEVLELLSKLKDRYNLTYLFISHDISLIKFMSDRIMVMSDGNIARAGKASEVLTSPDIK